jgi:hypothetical protein
MSERSGRIAVAASLVWIAVAMALILGTHNASVASAEAMDVESPGAEWMVMPAKQLEAHVGFGEHIIVHEEQIQC